LSKEFILFLTYVNKIYLSRYVEKSVHKGKKEAMLSSRKDFSANISVKVSQFKTFPLVIKTIVCFEEFQNCNRERPESSLSLF
jgi:hypothetical protein